jgi:hypothetical protein
MAWYFILTSFLALLAFLYGVYALSQFCAARKEMSKPRRQQEQVPATTITQPASPSSSSVVLDNRSTDPSVAVSDFMRKPSQ